MIPLPQTRGQERRRRSPILASYSEGLRLYREAFGLTPAPRTSNRMSSSTSP